MQSQSFAFKSQGQGPGEPSEDFLYFLEYKSMSLKYYVRNPHLCGEGQTTYPKALACSVLNTEPVVWKQSDHEVNLNFNSNAMFFGEAHFDQDVKIEFSNLLHELNRNGYTTLGLEMFPSSTQIYLDQFVQEKITLNEIVDILEQHWFYDSTGYREILKQAKALNMKIIGTDNRVDYKDPNVWLEVSLRDDHMAKVLAKHIEKTKEKIVVYSGRMHSVKSFGHGQGLGLSEKLKKELGSSGIEITTENILLAQTSKSSIYKDVVSSKTLYSNESVILRNADYGHIADAMIYVQPRGLELLFTMNGTESFF